MAGKPFAVGAFPGAADLNALVGVYDRSTAAVDVVSSAVETELYSKDIGAGHMSTDRMLRLSILGDYLNDSGAARNLTIRVAFGGNFYSSTFGNVAVSATRRPFAIELNLANLGAANVNYLFGTVHLGSATLIGGGATGIGDLQGGHESADSALGAAKTKTTPFATAGLGAINTAVAQALEVFVTHSASHASLSCRKHYGLLELL